LGCGLQKSIELRKKKGAIKDFIAGEEVWAFDEAALKSI